MRPSQAAKSAATEVPSPSVSPSGGTVSLVLDEDEGDSVGSVGVVTEASGVGSGLRSRRDGAAEATVPATINAANAVTSVRNSFMTEVSTTD